MTNTMAGVPVSFTEFRVSGPQGSRAYDVAPMEHLDSLLDIIDQGEARFGERLFAGERFLNGHAICPLRSHPTHATLLRVRHRMPWVLSLDRSQADYEDENPAENWPFCSQPVETRLSPA